MKIQSINNQIYRYKKTNKPSFKGFACSEHDFEVKSQYGLPCPKCSYPMILRNQIDNFVNSIQNKTGDDLVEILMKYKKYFHKNESEASELIIKEANKDPSKNISELAKSIVEDFFVIYQQEQLDLIEQLKKVANGKMPYSERKDFLLFIEKYENILLSQGSFDKKEFLIELKKQNFGNRSSETRAIKLAEAVSDIDRGAIGFLIKNSPKTQAELASRFVTPSYITCEHVIPKSQGGLNNTENYLAECEECNSKRGDKSFDQWIVSIPAFIKNFSEYLEKVKEKIESGQISSAYADYLSDITKTVSKATKGKISVKPPVVNIPQEIKDKDIKTKLAQLKTSYNAQMQELQKLLAHKDKSLCDEQFAYIVEYTRLSSLKDTINQQLDEKNKEVNDLSMNVYRYHKKAQELDEKKLELQELDPNSKKAGVIRLQISKIKNFLSLKSFSDIENAYNKAMKEYNELKVRREEILEQLRTLEEKIDFPKDFQKEIDEIRLTLYRIGIIQEQIQNLDIEILKDKDVEEKIQEKQNEMEALIEENKSIDMSLNNGSDIEKYRNMIYLQKRADSLEEAIKRSNIKFEETDNTIFELAKQKAIEIIDSLIQASLPVKHQANLAKISEITEELRNLHFLQGKISENKSKRDALNQQLQSFGKVEDLNKKLEELNEKLEQAKQRFSYTNIETRIEYLQGVTSAKKQIFEKLERNEISEEEALVLISEL